MAYDLEEQESLAEIKAWWEKWGTLILSVMTVLCLAAAAFQGWRWYQMKEAADAGTLYGQLIQAENARESSRVQAISQRLRSDYGSTVYAGLSALVAAASAQQANNLSDATKNLQWILDGDKAPELKGVAAVRLAGIYLDEGKYDSGLALLEKYKNNPEVAVLVYDRLGDLYYASGNKENARSSWESALKNAADTNSLVPVIQTKLTSLPAKEK